MLTFDIESASSRMHDKYIIIDFGISIYLLNQAGVRVTREAKLGFQCDNCYHAFISTFIERSPPKYKCFILQNVVWHPNIAINLFENYILSPLINN